MVTPRAVLDGVSALGEFDEHVEGQRDRAAGQMGKVKGDSDEGKGQIGGMKLPRIVLVVLLPTVLRIELLAAVPAAARGVPVLSWKLRTVQ